MRILYFVERFWPLIGGVEVMSARVLPRLGSRGFEVTVVTTGDGQLPDRDTFEGLDVHRLPIDQAMRGPDLEALAVTKRRYTEIKRELRPDVVHMVFTGPGILFPVITANIEPCPIVMSFHGSWPRADLERHGLLRRAVEVADWLTACSDAALADLRVLDESIAARSETILNGLEPPASPPSPLRVDPPVLLCSGRIEPEKGYDVAVYAVALLRERYPGIRLRIAGDGTQHQSLAALVDRLGLHDTVELLGWRSPDEVPALVDDSSVVLVPSYLEGFGLIALEGMLGERPVVASRAGGLVEVLGEDGGVLVEPGSTEAIASAVARLIDDPDEARRVARAGRLRAQARFALDRCVDDHERMYRRLTNGHVH